MSVGTVKVIAIGSGPRPENVPLVYMVDDVQYRQDFMEKLYQLQQEKQHTDVILKTSDLEIPCHWLVLSAASDYFHAMFNSGMKEATDNVVELEGVDTFTLEVIIKFIYTGEIMLCQNIENIVQVCDMIQIEALKAQCEKFMLLSLETWNCIGFHHMAKQYNFKALEENALKVILTKFTEVVKSEEFLELSADSLKEYISSDELNVGLNEDLVFEAAVLWVKHDYDARKHSFGQNLLPVIRLPFCTSAYLWSAVKQSDLMLSTDCQVFMDEALKLQMLPDQWHKMNNGRIIPRLSFQRRQSLVLVGGFNQYGGINTYCHYLDDKTSAWKVLTELAQPEVRYFSACVVQNGILITGGRLDSTPLTLCWLYDICDKKWKTMPPLSVERYAHVSVVLGGRIYVFGGRQDDYDALDQVECLNLRLRKWEFIPAMPKALFVALVAGLGHSVYMFAGIDEDEVLSLDTFVYDTVLRDWKIKAKMPEPCAGGAVVALNEKLYVVGGDHSVSTVCICYDPAVDCWTKLKSPREQHEDTPALVWNGKILVFGGGGEGGATGTSLIEEYEPETDEWSNWNVPLNEALFCHQVLILDLNGLGV